MNEYINHVELKKDLINYFGTAMSSGNPMAIIELSTVETGSEQQLLEIAVKNGFDLTEYIEPVRK